MVCKRDALTLIIAEKEILLSGNRHEKEAYQVDNYKKSATYSFCYHWRNSAGMSPPELCRLHVQGFVGLFRIMSFAFHGIFYDRVLFCVAAFLFTKKAITVLPGAIGPCNRTPFSFLSFLYLPADRRPGKLNYLRRFDWNGTGINCIACYLDFI